jgi:multicomponent K+:H+ antiporter subunit A
VGAGIGAWFVGDPFLTSLTADVVLPVIGELHLSTVLIFDFGVLALVFGATVLMLIALAHQSLRSYGAKPRNPPADPLPEGGG